MGQRCASRRSDSPPFDGAECTVGVTVPQLGDVGPRCEHPRCARVQEQVRRLPSGGGEHRLELLDRRLIERVVPLRPVERHPPERPVA